MYVQSVLGATDINKTWRCPYISRYSEHVDIDIDYVE